MQARQPATRYVLTDAGDLPSVVRQRVDQTVVASQRAPLPDRGGVLLVARRIPGQAAREWSVVFDDDADRCDPVKREVARQKLAEAVAAEQPELSAASAGGVAAHLALERGHGVVGAGLRHAGDALQARVVLGVLPGAADLLVPLASGAGAEHVAGAETGEERQLRHGDLQDGRAGSVITLPVVVRRPRLDRGAPRDAPRR